MEETSFYLIFSPAWVLLSYLLYWPLFFKHIEEGSEGKILKLRYYGVFLFGLVPVLVCWIQGTSPVKAIGLGVNISEKPVLWLISFVLGLTIAGMNYFLARREDNLKEFPQIRKKNWSVGLAFNNILSWTIYVIAYEFLFRGILLFPLVPEIGFWPAAVFGTVIYSLSHYSKNLKEAIGTIPFGLVLAFLAWETQSVWPVIWIHLCLALSNSIFSFMYHPEMQLRMKNLK